MVRLLTVADVPKALALSTAAGWNQTAEDWQRVIELEPRGCFGIDHEGELVGTTTLLCFGVELAWVGMVLTRKDQQRKGHARRLVTAALDEARGRGVRCVKLDATDQGRPLYANLGFIDEQPIERWAGQGSATSSSLTAGVIDTHLDSEAFGADRLRFLNALGQPPMVSDGGYVMTRPGTRAKYIGPCVARSPEAAERLIRGALAAGPWFWDLLPSNSAASALCASFGFEPVRHLIRMRFGAPIDKRDDYVFAIAGFEAG